MIDEVIEEKRKNVSVWSP